MAGNSVGTNGTDGDTIGATTSNKVSLYGVTPVVQRSSTVLATSLLSASSYVTVGSNMAAIFTEISNVLTTLGACRTTA